MGLGEVEQAVEEAGGPGRGPAAGLSELAGQAERQKRSDGAGAHGGEVAEAAGKGAMADGFGWVPIEAEVAAGDGEVGGDGQFLAWTQADEGAVVANAQAQTATGDVWRSGANLGEKSSFSLFAAHWACPVNVQLAVCIF
jgi:hypothetical protein